MPRCTQGGSRDPEPLWEVPQLEQESWDPSCPGAEGCLSWCLLLAWGEDLPMLPLPCCMWLCGETACVFLQERIPSPNK